MEWSSHLFTIYQDKWAWWSISLADPSFVLQPTTTLSIITLTLTQEWDSSDIFPVLATLWSPSPQPQSLSHQYLYLYWINNRQVFDTTTLKTDNCMKTKWHLHHNIRNLTSWLYQDIAMILRTISGPTDFWLSHLLTNSGFVKNLFFQSEESCINAQTELTSYCQALVPDPTPPNPQSTQTSQEWKVMMSGILHSEVHKFKTDYFVSDPCQFWMPLL